MSKRPARPDAFVVLRCAGERTEELSLRLLADEVGPDRVAAIHEVPFSRAVERTFELGIDAGLPWTIAVDADVLVRAGGIGDLVALARRADKTVFKVGSRVVDKLFGGPRSGGLHLYRTSLLRQALEFVDRDGPVHRPEFHVVQHMQQIGFGMKLHDHVLGMHDFEQAYHDLMRKGFVHAQKHAAELEVLEPMWRRLAEQDFDYRAALAGMEAGRSAGGIAKTDIRAFRAEGATHLAEHGLVEKPPLPADAYTTQRILALVHKFKAAPEFAAWQRSLRWRGRRMRLRRLVGGFVPSPLRNIVTS